MNARILFELFHRLLEGERENTLQEKLKNLTASLTRVVSAPQDSASRDSFAEILRDTRASQHTLWTSLSPTERARVEHLDLERFYNGTFIDELLQAMAEEPISPSNANQKLKDFVDERAEFVEETTKFVTSMEYLYPRDYWDVVAQPEIGFTLPREMFDGTIDGFMKELKTIRYCITTLGGLTNDGVQEITIGEISSSDPLIFLGIDVKVIAAVAGAITWCLDTWQRVDDLISRKKTVAEVEALKDLEKTIDDRISKAVEEAIQKKAAELTKGKKDKELTSSVEFVLKLLLERVERGMTIELRLPQSEDNQDTSEPSVDEQTVAELVGDLAFPQFERRPVLKLEHRVDVASEPKVRGG